VVQVKQERLVFLADNPFHTKRFALQQIYRDRRRTLQNAIRPSSHHADVTESLAFPEMASFLPHFMIVRENYFSGISTNVGVRGG